MRLQAISRGLLVSGVLGLMPLMAGDVGGQEPESVVIPCRAVECALVLEFEGLNSSGAYTRYGSPTMFEPQLLVSLTSMGYRISRDAPQSGPTLVLLRPRIVRAICDAVPGTNTGSCPALGEFTVELRRPDQEAVRLTVRNRCSADSYMHVEAFGEYAAQMIDLWLREAEGTPSRSRFC
jgi:hypothetical protein